MKRLITISLDQFDCLIAELKLTAGNVKKVNGAYSFKVEVDRLLQAKPLYGTQVMLGNEDSVRIEQYAPELIKGVKHKLDATLLLENFGESPELEAINPAAYKIIMRLFN